jgi:hypothetical protein
MGEPHDHVETLQDSFEGALTEVGAGNAPADTNQVNTTSLGAIPHYQKLSITGCQA